MKKLAILAMTLLIGCAANVVKAQPARAPGTVFRDCPTCPEMVVIPPGRFIMGQQGTSRETPTHQVTFAKSFSIGKFEVTFDEWDACAADGGCAGMRPNDGGWGRGRRPVINVSWDDAKSYAAWLSRKTGQPYRLASEAEWEYVARAGSTTVFPWGDSIGRGNANCDGCGSPYDNKQTAPVGSFPANAFGVHDMIGNVTEWVEDHWNSDYQNAPSDGSVAKMGDPKRVVMRNGAWYNGDSKQRSSYRQGDSPAVRNTKIGFRVAKSLP